MRRSVAVIAILLLTAGCSTGPGTASPSPGSGGSDVGSVVPPGLMKLGALNSTTKALVLVVNGQRIQDLEPGAQVEVFAPSLPALPWTAEVRLPTGRSLVSLTVNAGDVLIGPSSEKGDAIRVGLSCGSIDLWSGPSLGGPAPPTGSPGDCDP